jgi:membrane-bound serine protease (ClpP class)
MEMLHHRGVTCSGRVLVACLVAAAFAGLAGDARAARDRSAQGGNRCAGAVEPAVVDVVELEGVIDPPSSGYLLTQLEAASADGAELVVVELDTPGGLDVSMRQMVQRILASDVPVVVWVSPSGARAASAGVFVTMAAHVAAMAPGTSIGAAHPVNLGGEQDDVTSEKATNDAAALLRSIATRRGRNADWANRAVRESVALGAEEAARDDVVDFVASSRRTLLERIDGKKVEAGGREVTLSTACYELRFHMMGLFERILHTAISPDVAYFLLLLGLLGIVFEIMSPGIGAAGVFGGICLVLAAYALSILPTSWAGVALLVLAVLFLVIDLSTAGLGIFTAGSVVALVGGSILLFSGAGPELRLGWGSIAAAVAGLLLFFLVVMRAVVRARRSRPMSGAEGIVGTLGEARTDLDPLGRVMARGTLWKARAAGAAIPQGARVRVRSVSGLLLVVEQAESPASREGTEA